MEKAGGQLGPGPPAFSRVRPQGLAEEAPESASSDPTRGPSGEALADPAVLDGLVVAEEPGEGVEQAARAGDGHGSTFSIATKPEIQRNRRGRCDRSRRDAANEAVGRIEGGQETPPRRRQRRGPRVGGADPDGRVRGRVARGWPLFAPRGGRLESMARRANPKTSLAMGADLPGSFKRGFPRLGRAAPPGSRRGTGRAGREPLSSCLPSPGGA
jgi:hypothetical protein